MIRILATAALALSTAACISVDTTEVLPAPAPEAATEAAAPVNLVILYTLKDGVTPADFEEWVVTRDHPTMRGLTRVKDFQTYRADGLLTGEGTPSVAYIETFAIDDMAGFGSEDMASEAVQAISSEFTGFAEAPQFILVTPVD
ncbi:MAG: REDY-like protein HapK [Hyphomonas sp.]